MSMHIFTQAEGGDGVWCMVCAWCSMCKAAAAPSLSLSRDGWHVQTPSPLATVCDSTSKATHSVTQRRMGSTEANPRRTYAQSRRAHPSPMHLCTLSASASPCPSTERPAICMYARLQAVCTRALYASTRTHTAYRDRNTQTHRGTDIAAAPAAVAREQTHGRGVRVCGPHTILHRTLHGNTAVADPLTPSPLPSSSWQRNGKVPKRHYSKRTDQAPH